MTTLLLFVSLPTEHNSLVEKLVKSAQCFLETSGAVDAKKIAIGERLAGKGRSREQLNAIAFVVANSEGSDVRARRLEGVLRETLVDANVPHGDLRVFVADETKE